MKKEISNLVLQKIKETTTSSYPNICPDKVFGKYYANVFPKLKCKYRDIEPNDQAYAIVLVLESPHIYEFNSEKQGIAPAKGSTGENIKKYLKKIFDKPSSKKMLNLAHDQIYDVILVNAIQLQCSLGEKTCMYRDIVFLYHWEDKKWRNNFAKRIKNIFKNYSKGGLIINCCTKGTHINTLTKHKGSVCKKYLNEIGFDYSYNVATLQGMVEKEIKKSISEEKNWKNFVSTHPASWNRNKRNRRIKEKLK